MFTLELFGKRIIGIGREKSINQLLSTDFDDFFGRTGVNVKKSKAKALDNYSGWVFDCVNLISNYVSVAEMELYTTKGSEDTPVESHIFYDLWDVPNPMFTGRMLRELVQAHLDLSGEGYLLKTMNGIGRPQELWPLIPSNVELKYVRGEYLYEVQTPNGKVTYPQDQVVYLRYSKPSDPLRGWSPLQAKGLEYDTDTEIDKYYWQMMNKGAYFHYALSTDQLIVESQAKQIQEMWSNKLDTISKKFSPPIFPKGLKPVQLQGSPLDLGTQEKSEELRDKILAAYGVPKALLGMLEGVMRANLEGAEVGFIKGSILPRLDTWADGLLPTIRAYDQRLKMRFKQDVPRDRDAYRQETQMLLQSGAISIEEARQRHGYTPDIDPSHTVYMPISLLPTSRTMTGGGEAVPVDKTAPTPKGYWTEDRKEAYQLKFERDTEQREKRWMPVVRSWIDKWERDALKMLQESFARTNAKYAGWSPKKVMEDFKASTPNTERYEEIIITAAGKLHFQDFKEAAEEVVQFLGLSFDFDMARPEVVQYLGEKTRNFAISQVRRLADELETVLREGYAGGLTIDELIKNVKQLYKFERTYRAERIARTEVISASNRATREAGRQGGIRKKSWSSARDPYVRDSHRDADIKYSAEPIDIDEMFVLDSGATGMEPGNTGNASEDINCRCSVRLEVEVE